MSSFTVRNPARDEAITELKEDTRKDIRAKLLAARQAQKQFKNTSIEKRTAILQKFKRNLRSKRRDLAEILTLETGKPISQSLSEIKAMNQRLDFFIEHTAEQLKTQILTSSPSSSVQEYISYEPLGVLANISAWNYPYFVGSNVFVPALLCGNSVLYKPSEYSSMTGLEIAKLFTESDLMPNVFQVILGKGEVGEALLAEELDAVFFTGSYRTGKKIAQALAPKMIPMQLELGGKDPAYVHKDVDVSASALSLAQGAFYNNGQSCCAVERIYAHTDIYSDFVREFAKAVAAFPLGDPMQSETFLGPLTRKEQIPYLEEQLEDALSKGAKLCWGRALSLKNKADQIQSIEPESEPELTKFESPERGYYFSPRVLTEVNHQMKIMKEETFGPLIGIQKVENEKEALDLMQDTEYGLTAAVYSKDKLLAETMLKEMESGTVYWNVCDRVSPYLPWSGRKHSGIGSTLSFLGIRAFLKNKAWHCLPLK